MRGDERFFLTFPPGGGGRIREISVQCLAPALSEVIRLAFNVFETLPGHPDGLPHFAALSQNAQYAQGNKEDRQNGCEGDRKVNLIQSHGIQNHPSLFI